MELNLASVICMPSHPVKTTLNIFVHVQKYQNQNLSTFTKAHQPKDRADIGHSMWQLKVGFGVHSNTLYAIKMQLLPWKIITNYHFVFPEN